MTERSPLKDKTAVEQMKLIQQLDEDDKQTIVKLIDKMLTNKKFKDFFSEKRGCTISKKPGLAGLFYFQLPFYLIFINIVHDFINKI